MNTSKASYQPRTAESGVDTQVAMTLLPLSKATTKGKQIVVRFDQISYNKIRAQAAVEHRGLGEFVRHAALDYIENMSNRKN